MTVLGICMLALGAILLVLAGGCFCLYITFERGGSSVACATGFLKDTKYKNNVHIIGANRVGGTPQVVKTVKDRCRGVYQYTVGVKTYKIRYVSFVTARQMPQTVSVEYLKKLPRLAYVKTEVSTQRFDIYAIACLGFSIMCILSGVRAFL